MSTSDLEKWNKLMGTFGETATPENPLSSDSPDPEEACAYEQAGTPMQDMQSGLCWILLSFLE